MTALTISNQNFALAVIALAVGQSVYRLVLKKIGPKPNFKWFRLSMVDRKNAFSRT
jgi:hypothetical protein